MEGWKVGNTTKREKVSLLFCLQRRVTLPLLAHCSIQTSFLLPYYTKNWTIYTFAWEKHCSAEPETCSSLNITTLSVTVSAFNQPRSLTYSTSKHSRLFQLSDWLHSIPVYLYYPIILITASLYQFDRKRSIRIFDSIQSIPSGCLIILVYRNTLIPLKPNCYNAYPGFLHSLYGFLYVHWMQIYSQQAKTEGKLKVTFCARHTKTQSHTCSFINSFAFSPDYNNKQLSGESRVEAFQDQQLNTLSSQSSSKG